MSKELEKDNANSSDTGENKQAGNADDTKHVDASGLQKQIDELKTINDKLSSNNQALVDEKRTIESRLKEIEKAKRDADTKKAHDEGDLETVRKRIEDEYSEKYGKDLSERDELKSQLNKLLIDGGLKDNLTKAGVSASLLEAAVYLIKGKYATEVKDGNPLVDGQDLSGFVTKFIDGDDGKHFLKAPTNAGGGAGSSGQGSTPTSKTISQMSLTEKAEFVKEHGLKAWEKKVHSESASNSQK